MKLKIGMLVDIESAEEKGHKLFSGAIENIVHTGAVVRVLGAFGSGTHLVAFSRIHPQFSLVEDANKYTPRMRLW